MSIYNKIFSKPIRDKDRSFIEDMFDDIEKSYPWIVKTSNIEYTNQEIDEKTYQILFTNSISIQYDVLNERFCINLLARFSNSIQTKIDTYQENKIPRLIYYQRHKNDILFMKFVKNYSFSDLSSMEQIVYSRVLTNKLTK